jgi:hypothetical protein
MSIIFGVLTWKAINQAEARTKINAGLRSKRARQDWRNQTICTQPAYIQLLVQTLLVAIRQQAFYPN